MHFVDSFEDLFEDLFANKSDLFEQDQPVHEQVFEQVFEQVHKEDFSSILSFEGPFEQVEQVFWCFGSRPTVRRTSGLWVIVSARGRPPCRQGSG